MAGIAKGTVFGGRYIVQSQVGTGGMATVYRGVDNVLDRPVAIKVMLPQYANDPAFAQRFKQEAQAAAALQNPYIVQVYDWGRDDATGTYYIVMEYLRGTDLKTGIRSHGALAPRKVAQIGAQVCSALSVAHAHDIIHRDIKPQNIMIQPNGDAKVMDFGIARAKNSHLTQTNSVLGTAHYVSPEQAQGKELGAASDLYSLGVVMYEAATGRLPFDGEDAVSVALKQVNELPVPPSRINPNVDDRLESIILRCMAKDPRQRFQNADELRHALNNYINGRPIGIPAYGTGPQPTTRLNGSPQPTQVLRPGESGRMPVQGRTGSNPRVSAGNTGPVQRTQRMAQPYNAPYGNVPYGNAPAGRPVSHAGLGNTDPRGRRGAAQSRGNGPVLAMIIGVLVILLVIAILVLTSCNSCSPGTGNSGPGATIVDGEGVLVPNLQNRTEAEAKSMLKARGLEVGEVTQQASSTVSKGKVISQSPTAETEVAEGSKVDLVVSLGSDKVSVPPLTGKTESEAQQLLTSNGLQFQHDPSLDAHHATIAQGLVVTYVPANNKVDAGTVVRYGLSKGVDPDTLKVAVPDFVTDAWSWQDAMNKLVEAELQGEVIEEYNEEVEAGKVFRTDPSAGTQVTKGTTVKLYVSKGKEPVKVPAYTDGSGSYTWSSASYQAALMNLELVPNVVTGEAAPSAALKGMVYATDPAAGTEIAKGSTVTVYVYGDPQVVVPNFNGATGSGYVEALRAVGLVGNVVEGNAAPDAGSAGLVYGTDPAPGAPVLSGTTVTVYVYSAYVAPTAAVPGWDATWGGSAYADAVRNAGLVPNVVAGDPAPSADLAGKVQWVDPGAGTQLAQGSTVTVGVYGDYVPPAPTTAAVPGFDASWSGSDYAAAVSAAGLAPNVVAGSATSDAGLDGRVEWVDPGAGTQLALGSTVTVYTYVYVAPAPQPEPTPEVTPEPAPEQPVDQGGGEAPVDEGGDVATASLDDPAAQGEPAAAGGEESPAAPEAEQPAA